MISSCKMRRWIHYNTLTLFMLQCIKNDHSWGPNDHVLISKLKHGLRDDTLHWETRGETVKIKFAWMKNILLLSDRRKNTAMILAVVKCYITKVTTMWKSVFLLHLCFLCWFITSFLIAWFKTYRSVKEIVNQIYNTF